MGILATCGLVCIGSAVPVSAVETKWPYDGNYTVHDVPVNRPPAPDCSESLITLAGPDMPLPTKAACVYNGALLRFTEYQSDNGYHDYAVSFPGETKFYHIDERNGHSFSMQFHEKTGAAILDNHPYYLPSGLPRLQYIDNLATALVPNSQGQLGAVYSYKIRDDFTKPLFVLQRGTDSRYFQVTGFIVSENQQHLLAWLDYGRMVRLDLQDNQYTIIAQHAGSWYGGIYNPEPAAISDDGRYAYINRADWMYDTRGCGDIFTIENMDRTQLEHPCPYANLTAQIHDMTGAKEYEFQFGFDDDDNQLLFQRQDGANRLAYILQRDNYQPTTQLDYLALGDSYSSGEGDIEKKADNTSSYTAITDGEDGCHISPRSDPFLLRDMYNIPTAKMQSVACSGAQVVSDYNRPLTGYKGQGNRLAHRSEEERKSEQSTALDRFIPGKVPQLEFAKKYKPKLITLTGGSNDVGFADILVYCASTENAFGTVPIPYTCDYAKEGSDLQVMLNNAIDTQYIYTKTLLDSLHRASPSRSL